MKPAIRNSAALLLCSVSSSYASTGNGNDTNGLFFWLFTGFALIIITFQFMPGITTFLDIARGLFTSGAKRTEGVKNSSVR